MLPPVDQSLEIRVLVPALQNQDCKQLIPHFEKSFANYTFLGSSRVKPIKWLFTIDEWSSEGRDVKKVYDLAIIFFYCNKVTRNEEANFYPLFKHLHENNLRPLDQQIPGRVLLITAYANEMYGSLHLRNLLIKPYFENLYKSESKINFSLEAVTLCAYQEEDPENDKRWNGKSHVQEVINQVATVVVKEKNLSFRARTRSSYYQSHSCPSYSSELTHTLSSSEGAEQPTKTEGETADKTPRKGSLPILLESTRSVKRISRLVFPSEKDSEGS